MDVVRELLAAGCAKARRQGGERFGRGDTGRFEWVLQVIVAPIEGGRDEGGLTISDSSERDGKHQSDIVLRAKSS